MTLPRGLIVAIAAISLLFIGQGGIAAARTTTNPAATSGGSRSLSAHTEKLTRVTLEAPQSVDKVASALKERKLAFLNRKSSAAGTPQVIEIRHNMNGHTGGLYPGRDYEKTLRMYKKAIRQQAGTAPRVTSFTMTGDASKINLGALQSLVKKRKVINQTPRRVSPTPTKAASPYDKYWQPWEAAIHLTNGGSDAPREFNYDFGWRNGDDMETGFGDRNAFELDVKLYNSALENIATRPNCASAGIPGYNTDYWAARTEDPPPQASLSTGGPLFWDTTIPGTAYPYFDYADYTDDCGVIDFSAGVTYPNAYGVQPDCLPGQDATDCTYMRYHFYIGAAAGTQPSSQYTVFMQKLTNNCPAQPPDPSGCVGLNNTDEARTHTLVPANSWPAPDCVMGYLDYAQDPQAPSGTEMYYPATHFSPGTWLPGWENSGDNRYHCR